MKEFHSLKTIRSIILFFLPILIFTSCSKDPIELKADADRYYDQAIDYYTRGYLNNANDLFAEVLEIDERLKLTDRRGNTLLYLGLIAEDYADYENAEKYYVQAKAFFNSKFDRRSEGMVENNIGNIYSKRGDYEKAVESYRRSLSISQISADKEGEGIAQLNIGTIFNDLEDHQRGYDYFNRALNNFEIINNEEGIVVSHNKIGESYLQFGVLSEALNSFSNALNRAEQYGMRHLLPDIANNIGIANFKLGNYQEAFDSFNFGLSKILTTEDDIVTAIYLNNNAGDAAKRLFRTGEAEIFYNKSLEIASKGGEGMLAGLIKLKQGMIAIENRNLDAGQVIKLKKEISSLEDFFEDIEFEPGLINSLALSAKLEGLSGEPGRGIKIIGKIEELIENNTISLENRYTSKLCLLPDALNQLKYPEIFLSEGEAEQFHNFLLKLLAVERNNFLRRAETVNVSEEGTEERFLTSKQKQMEFLKIELADQRSKGKGYRNNKRIKNLETRYESILNKDKEGVNEGGMGVSLGDLQKRLSVKKAIVSISEGDDLVIISVVDNKNTLYKEFPFSLPAVEGQIDKLIQAISTNNETEAVPYLRGLYSRFLKPVEKELNKYDELIILVFAPAESKLHLIPFHSLLNEEGIKMSEIKKVVYYAGEKGARKTVGRDQLIIDKGIGKEAIQEADQIIINVPVYFNTTQPASSYIDIKGGANNDTIKNLTINELLQLYGNRFLITDFYSDKNSAANLLATILKGEVISINRFSLPEEIRKSISEGKEPEGLFGSSIFNYIKL